MPTALADYRTRIRAMLVDTSSARYPDNQVDEALKQILTEYSDALPQVVSGSAVVSTAGRDQPVTGFTYPRQVLSLRYPYDSTGDPDAQSHPSFYFCYIAATPTIHINGSAIPQVGEAFQATYTTAHTIKNLPDASGSASGSTTVIPSHDTYIVIGAAGLCAIQRGSSLIEAFTSRSSDVAQLIAWGSTQLKIFRDFLASVKDYNVPPGELPGLWIMDQWDSNNR
jgi:hypothetical protein